MGITYSIYIYICIWAILKTLGSRNGHPQIWKGPNRLPHVCTKMIYGKLGGYRLQEKLYNDLLDSRAEAVLPFWSGIFAAGLWATWGGATGRGAFANLFFPTASIYGQLAGQPPLHSYSIASSPALLAYKPECFGAYQLSGGPWSLATLKTVTCDPKIPGHLRP